jgi:hypothetical protein
VGFEVSDVFREMPIGKGARRRLGDLSPECSWMVFQKPVNSAATAGVLARQDHQQRYTAAAISPRIERTCGDLAFCGSWADDVKHSDPTNKEQINNPSLFGRKCAQLFRRCLGLRRGSRPWIM